MLKKLLFGFILLPLYLISQFACSSNKSASDKIAYAPDSSIKIELREVFRQLVFDSPIAMVQPESSSDYWYVVERAGKIYRVPFGQPDTNEKVLYLDISDSVVTTSEGGLFSLAFHPDYESNHFVYLSYTSGAVEGSASSFVSVISRFTESVDSGLIERGSEVQILLVDQPFFNHNGGHIAFGLDGHLYIGFGDGGSGGDPLGHGQNITTFLGSILRIDVDAQAETYKIPDDNPFTGHVGRREIYAFGLRNPWRFSFDVRTGDFWLADVGQNAAEEVNLIVAGGNFGWNCFEASLNYKPQNCDKSSNTIPPVAEYGREEGVSITGGYVYRGEAMSELIGDYIFGDFSSGMIWHLTPTSEGYTRQLLLDSPHSIVSFAQANDKEIYVLDLYSGKVFQIHQN